MSFPKLLPLQNTTAATENNLCSCIFFHLKSGGLKLRKIIPDLKMPKPQPPYFSPLPRILFEKVLDTNEDTLECAVLLTPPRLVSLQVRFLLGGFLFCLQLASAGAAPFQVITLCRQWLWIQPLSSRAGCQSWTSGDI